MFTQGVVHAVTQSLLPLFVKICSIKTHLFGVLSSTNDSTRFQHISNKLGANAQILSIKIHFQKYWSESCKAFLPVRSSQSSTSLCWSGLCEPRRAGHVPWPVTVVLLVSDSWWPSVLAPGRHGHAVPKRTGNNQNAYNQHEVWSRYLIV